MPVEYYRALHRSDRLRFEVELIHVLKGDKTPNPVS
jgi:hypothetical protein